MFQIDNYFFDKRYSEVVIQGNRSIATFFDLCKCRRARTQRGNANFSRIDRYAFENRYCNCIQIGKKGEDVRMIDVLYNCPEAVSHDVDIASRLPEVRLVYGTRYMPVEI